jgi:hypothetical protein
MYITQKMPLLDKQYYCDVCDYKCFKKTDINKHFLTQKHVISEKKCPKVAKAFTCENCKFVCNKESNYNKHMNTKKHIKNTSKTTNIPICKCGKVYKNNRTLSFHKKKCSFMKENVEQINNDTISSIMNEIKILMIEQNKMNKVVTEIANHTTNLNNTTITNNNNSINNKQFNMNVFLNETCKDAMNLSDFLENLNVSMEDMEKTGELGFAKGMSRIIMNNLNAIDVCKRPIHCSDAKRETLYVKNNGVWEKETEDRKRTKEIIYKVSCLNERQLIKWRDLPRNKGYEKSDHVKNDEFMKLVMEINKLRDEEIDKVITAISKHVVIDKDRVKMSGYLN